MIRQQNFFLKNGPAQTTQGCLNFAPISKEIGSRSTQIGLKVLPKKTPSTNNGLEAVNRTIKSEITKYERLPLSRFLPAVMPLLQGWSKDRSPANKNAKMFAKEPVPTLSLWTSAYKWAISGNIRRKKDKETYYILPSNSQHETVTGAINQFKEKEKTQTWNDFDDFRYWSRTVWKVSGISAKKHLVINLQLSD